MRTVNLKAPPKVTKIELDRKAWLHESEQSTAEETALDARLAAHEKDSNLVVSGKKLKLESD